ncbi:hybrid non-ribosomal peptide synthetase/type I polyketide synthase [Psychromonas sp. Urea-02u-13]|uniref:hybrid non-ribosomal peptide synthetase/type I polyketide synthase n=1 Tax=Psychromonas sp. Urea-02u-13 TaxID=2058326 RepID=UPI000C33BF5E|nr:hybrid non-ribosomal peptide synthetase/type I polyketide synthase [Psychromonas sp. Urea-02u-13]PKG39105.1 non-ribosomal peptide synthetase [Psychromonas sp. Urea-02u-13]
MEELNVIYGDSDPIAVIGLACRFPKAPDIESFWHNLINGITGQSRFSINDLEEAGISPYIYKNENFVASGAVIERPEYFDAALFGYSPNEALSIDPQQRIFLQNVWHALEHAGHPPTEVKTKTGVFGSIRTSTYPSFKNFNVTQVGQVKGLQALVGNDKDYLATRVSHKLNLTGPAFTVQTACSSSLVATHLACESLRSGECDMAIAGGVAVSFPQKSGYEYQPGMIFSPDGLCRPFDVNANGTFGGHGVGSVVLKRLENALQDGDNVLAVLRGSAINNDGHDKVGFTAPSMSGQAQVLTDAIHLADVKPADVEMIETHGTGTKLGDPIEIAAIKQAYQRQEAPTPCYLGSVKSSLGHLDTVAGIASLIKTVLSVSRGKIPATLNIEQANPALQLDNSGFELAEKTYDWQRDIRTAAVSSFGIGGTNCHIIVQSTPNINQPVALQKSDSPSLFISANSEYSLRKLAKDYAPLLRENNNFDDIAFSALTTRVTNLPFRLAVKCKASSATLLEHFSTSAEIGINLQAGRELAQKKVTWCFTGQGSQYAGMGREVYSACCVFKQSIEASQSYSQGLTEYSLLDVMFGNKSDLLGQTDYAQLAIVAFEIAMMEHWKSKGFSPDLVLGHSVGEFAACVTGGYLTHQQAIQLVVKRGQLMHECAKLTTGKMIAVFASEHDYKKITALAELDLAACNGLNHWVFSGHVGAIERAKMALKSKEINFRILDVPCAAHSKLLDDILLPFSNFADNISVTTGKIPLISSLTGQLLSSSTALNGHYWSQHMRKPVKFRQAIKTALSQGSQIFVEIGPDAHLSTMGKREDWQQETTWLSSHKRDIKQDKSTLNVLHGLYVAGLEADWLSQLKLSGHKCALPLYTFDEQKYWYEAETCAASNPVSSPVSSRAKMHDEETSVLPETLESCYDQLRCCAIQDFVVQCRVKQKFTLKDIIRGGRLLPRYRLLVLDLLKVLTDYGYYTHKHGVFEQTDTPLLTAKQLTGALRKHLEKSIENTQLSYASINNLVQSPSLLKAKLSRFDNAQGNCIEADILLTQAKQYTLATSAKKPAFLSNNSNIIYQNWSVSKAEKNLQTALSKNITLLVKEDISGWEISQSSTLSVSDIGEVAICSFSGMWGQIKYQIHAKSPRGNWQWLAEAKTKDFVSSNSAELLSAPHNHYQWQWQEIKPGESCQSLPNDIILKALNSPGQIHSVNSTQSLLSLPEGDLNDISASMASALSSDYDTLYILASGAVHAQKEDNISPEKFALVSLLRVARKEYPNKRILMLDINSTDSSLIAEVINKAPFDNTSEIAYREKSYFSPSLKHAATSGNHVPAHWFASKGWHLITGGMGGIGRVMIEWLALSGVKNIAVLGRSVHQDWHDFTQKIEAMGCLIKTLTCDLAKPGELDKTLLEWQPTLPIIGAFHAAGGATHGTLANWPEQNSTSLIQTKSIAMKTLYQWLTAHNAQYLIGFSSVATLGAKGQGLYAITNAYLDGFSLQQTAQSGCRVMSIGWGAWDKVGMTNNQMLINKLAEDGMHTMQAQEGLWHLSQCLLNGQTHSMAMNVESSHVNFEGLFANNTDQKADRNLDLLCKATETALTSQKQIKQIKQIKQEDLPGWLTERIVYQLGLSASVAIDNTQDLLQLGMDSLQFLELSAVIQKQFNVKINAEEAYQNMSIEGLTVLIHEKLQSDNQAPPALPFVAENNDKYAPFPLTPIQHAYWIGRESWIEYGGIACHVVFEWDKDLSDFNPQKFESAWNALIERHDMLRMTVTSEGEQVILEKVPSLQIPQSDLRFLSASQRHNELMNTRKTMSNEVRPANIWPLFDLRLSRISDTKIRLHMNLDLLQFDVQSFKIMMDDLTDAYQGLTLPTMPITFRDYVMHEHKLRQQSDWKASWDYWQKTIPTLPKAPQLPLNSRYNNEKPKFITLEGKLDSEHWKTLKSEWQKWGITPSAGLLTLFSETLAQHAESADFTLNMTFFNRQPFHKSVQEIIGDFTSVLLMDFMLSKPASVKDRMLATQNKLWQRLGHSQVNGVEVIREMAKHLKASGKMSQQDASQPLTPIVFTSLLGMSMDGMDIEKAMTSMLGDPVFVLSQTPQVWLDHQIMEVDGDLVFNWYCMSGVLENGLLDKLFSDYNQKLSETANNPILMERLVDSITLDSLEQPSLNLNVNFPKIESHIEEEVKSAWEFLEHQALSGLWDTLTNHQLFVCPGKTYSVEKIRHQLNVTTKHVKLIDLWLDQLCRDNVLLKNDIGFEFTGEFPLPPASSLPDKNWCKCLSQYLSENISAHKALLDGSKSALELLFKDDQVTDSLYRTNPSLKLLNESAAKVVEALSGNAFKAFNVLEIGAGTASTTRDILEKANNTINHYRFTDISQVFLQEAKLKLSDYSQVSYQLFDINKPADTSLNIEGGYHAIIAVNVLHDAENLPATLNRLRALLAQDGHLILIEATDQFSPMQLATVGFIEGINAFSDFREQQKSAMLSLPTWLTLLEENGFEPQLSFPKSEQSVLRQHLVVAKMNISAIKQTIQHDVIAYQVPAVISEPLPNPLPNTSALNKIQHLWSSMLNGEINQSSDFFQSGGDSLMATKMVVALNKAGFTKASLPLIFEKSVLTDFALAISNAPETATDTKPHELTCSTLTKQVENIRCVWENLLNQTVINNTDFFQDGGDSLMATKMVVALQQAGLAKASLQQIFEQPIFSDFCRVMGEADSRCQLSPLKDVVKQNEYTLTALQNAYWLGESDMFSLGKGIAHFYAELEIQNLNQDRFTQAWNELIKNHDQLRGTIKDGQYHIATNVPYYQPQYVNLTAEDESSKQRIINDARHRIATNGISTDQWPLFDISIVQTDRKTSLVHLVIDLVVADGRSLNLIFTHLQILYQDINAKLDLCSITAGQYLEQLDNLKTTADYQIAKDYWLNRLPSLPEAPALPLNDKRLNTLSQSVLTHSISKEEWAQLRQVSLANDVLPSITMLATFCLVLKKWSETKHFSINVLHSNRQHLQPDSDSVIGNLSTTSMLEVNATEQKSFIAFIKQIQQQMSDDLAHAIFDGQQVLTEKNRHNRNFSAGMPVVFNDTTSVGQNKPLDIGKLNEFGAQTPHVYLDCMLIASSCGGIDIKWTIQKSHLKPGVFDAMFATYIKSVSSMLCLSWKHPLYLPLDALQINTRHLANATSKKWLLTDKNGQEIAAETLCDLMIHGIELQPTNLAIQQGNLKLTYRQVWDASRSLASQILSKNDGSPLVAIVMKKGWEQVISAIAIILAGKAYMPIDASYPQKRIEDLLEQGGVNTIIGQYHDLDNHFSNKAKYQIIVPCLSQKIAPDFTLPKVQPSDLAYVIFTSGSTGKPKGVMMDHKAVVNTLLDINQRINLTDSDNVLAISALNFDLSVFDIFSTLCQGATLVIPEVSSAEDPEALIALANNSNITVWNSVPAFVQLLADSLEQNKSTQASIRQIMMSGDWIPVNLPDRLTKLTPNAQVLSLGGATEAAIWSISHPITKSYSNRISIPYGKPLSNQNFHILDDQLAPCPEWVSGEIYIGGNGLAIGYWKDKEQTDTAFRVHPTHGLRLYKTGDLGRYLPNGDIEFIGRNDHQVKVNGYRVELGEIEHILRQYTDSVNEIHVQEAIVKPFKHANGGIQLIGYIVFSHPNEESNEQLLNYVREILPAYMCPAQIVILDTLPLTLNGKVDRKALLRPDFTTQAVAFCQPSSEMEIMLAKHWKACLNLASIPANQGFFELGGNSLIAVRLINKINSALKLSLTAGHFQANDTIERLADFINTKNSHSEVLPTRLTASQNNNSNNNNNSTLFIIHPIGGHLLSYQGLATQLHNVTLYGLSFPEQYILQHNVTVEQLAREYLTMIKKIQPQGPYQISGWSFGGVVAFELANQMIKQGHQVTQCIMIDSYKPGLNDLAELNDMNIRKYFYHDCVGRFPTLNETSTPDFSDEASFSASLSKALACTIKASVLDEASITHLFHIYRSNLLAMMKYQPPILQDLPVTLFTAKQNKQLEFMRYQRSDIVERPCHGWTDCCTPVITEMHADHYTILQEPNVTQLANYISQLLTKPQHSVVAEQNILLEEFENE